jgi:hypothetical protein
VQRAPGIPHALCFLGESFLHNSGASRRGNAELCRQQCGCLKLRRAALYAEVVMPGLVPGIHVLLNLSSKDVDGRDEPGHDGDVADDATFTHFAAAPLLAASA